MAGTFLLYAAPARRREHPPDPPPASASTSGEHAARDRGALDLLDDLVPGAPGFSPSAFFSA